MPLATKLAELFRACFTGIWIESHEHQDAMMEIAQLCRDEEWRLAVWDIERGLHLPGQPASEAALRGVGCSAHPRVGFCSRPRSNRSHQTGVRGGFHPASAARRARARRCGYR